MSWSTIVCNNISLINSNKSDRYVYIWLDFRLVKSDNMHCIGCDCNIGDSLTF